MKASTMKILIISLVIFCFSWNKEEANGTNENNIPGTGEQLRWFDLKRTGKLVERVRAWNPDAAPNIQPFPIPQSQLDAITNTDEFTQNEGYQ